MGTDITADVAIVGAGPTGAAAAWRLATAGLRVACIERGGWFDHAGVPSDGYSPSARSSRSTVDGSRPTTGSPVPRKAITIAPTIADPR